MRNLGLIVAATALAAALASCNKPSTAPPATPSVGPTTPPSAMSEADKQKALAALDAFEQSIGGTLDERIARKTAAWRQANGYPPLPPTKQA
jgi:ABC-type glycerol-3-phosphate transport system substrate-binding protein